LLRQISCGYLAASKNEAFAMQYVVKIEYDNANGDEKIDFKSFTRREDAEARWNAAWVHIDGKPLKKGGVVTACFLFSAEADNAARAVQIVRDGNGVMLRSDDDAYTQLFLDIEMGT
jgi:hypothetical protein